MLLLYTSFVVGRELWMVMPYMDLGSVRSIMRKAWPQVCFSCQESYSMTQDFAHLHGCMGCNRLGRCFTAGSQMQCDFPV